MVEVQPVTGAIEGASHVYPIRVYYEDTDAGGVVYHASYLRFAERARTEMLRCLGIPHQRLIDQYGISIVVSRVEADYLSPARLDDALVVASTIVARGGASVKMTQIVSDAASETVRAKLLVRLAAIDGQGRPTRLPDEFSDKTGLAGGVNKI